MRVLVNSVADCYHALGVIHHQWTPLQERIKDYIASPKSNGYQSLHTTMFGPGGQLYEIQIRTREMHRTAEYGIAAHWLYKEGEGRPTSSTATSRWFRQLLELQQDAHTPEEFLEFLKVDLYQDEIFVFTPRGDVKRLPKGATPIDFAFAVHTEVGLSLPGRARQRPHRAAAPAAEERRHGRDPHEPAGPAVARLARARAHRAGAPQDPAVDPPGGARPAAWRSGGRSWTARSGAGGSSRPTPSSWREPRSTLSVGTRRAARGRARAGRRGARAGDARALSRPPRRRPAGAQADGVRAGDPAPAAGPRDPDPGRRRPDGALRAVLPAGAGRPGGGLRDPGTRHLDPPRRLSQPPAALGRSRAPGRDRLAGVGGGDVRRAARGARARTAAASTPTSARR